jgi:hypothetical protein
MKPVIGTQQQRVVTAKGGTHTPQLPGSSNVAKAFYHL